jgi:hypothetical protein
MAVIWIGAERFGAALDPDAQAYITAVEAADTQALEVGVKDAINAFVVGCKADGTWSAIKASCIMAGARTLAGALVPLVGAAPTRFGTEGGWNYNRKTGTAGNGTNNYLDSGRNNNADPQNSNHNAVLVSSAASATSHLIGSHALATTGANSIFSGSSFSASGAWNRSNGSTITSLPTSISGFIGHSRNSATTFSVRNASSTSTSSVSSSVPANGNILVFCRGTPATSFTDARLAFYSIGESLDLALLDARVTALINAIAAAIP